MSGNTLRGLPSFKALRALSIIVAEGSFERAAQRLHVSRSSVSHLIRDLERQLGARLLERSPRGVVVTADGSALLSGMGDSLLRIEGAVEAFYRDRDQIRLSTVATLASHWLLPRLAGLQAKHPHLRLSISTATRAVDFAREDIDCGIRHGSGSWPGLSSMLLFTEALVLVGRRDMAASIAPGDLAERVRSIRIIRARTRPDDLRQWWQGMALGGATPPSSLIVENRAQAIAAALAGAGATLIDPRFMDGATSTGDLVTIDPRPVPLASGYFYVVPERNRSRRNVTLIGSWLAAEAQNTAA
jgi:DNA-binding transcriptional LysR family regulator